MTNVRRAAAYYLRRIAHRLAPLASPDWTDLGVFTRPVVPEIGWTSAGTVHGLTALVFGNSTASCVGLSISNNGRVRVRTLDVALDTDALDHLERYRIPGMVLEFERNGVVYATSPF